MKQVVISFLGEDKPGIVDRLAMVISQNNGNWQASSMRHLSGYFAGMAEISVSDANAQALAEQLQQIDGLNVQVALSHTTPAKPKTIRLDLTANDRQGIVAEISAVIHKKGGNLVKLVSSQGSAPHSGQTIFKATANIAIIDDDHTDDLISALETIADDLIVDILV